MSYLQTYLIVVMQNWQWDNEVRLPNRPRRREAASIHIRAGDSSTISYMMPMVATTRGYEPTLHVHLDTVTVTSSLNDIRVLTAAFCSVRTGGSPTVSCADCGICRSVQNYHLL